MEIIKYDIDGVTKELEAERTAIDAAYVALVARQRSLEDSVRQEAANVALHLKKLKAHHKQLTRAIPRRILGFTF